MRRARISEDAESQSAIAFPQIGSLIAAGFLGQQRPLNRDLQILLADIQIRCFVRLALRGARKLQEPRATLRRLFRLLCQAMNSPV